MKEIVQKSYDIIAVEYNANRLTRKEVVSQFFDSISGYFPESGEVLDLGCGGGEPVTNYFASKGYKITGIDISKEMIELARKQVPAGTFIHDDMCVQDFKEGQFDIIVSTFAVIHIPQSEQDELLRNIHYWLKFGGVAFLTLGASNEEHLVREWKGVTMYWSHYAPEKYREIFKTIGFDLIWDKLEELPNGEKFYNVILKKEVIPNLQHGGEGETF